MKERLARYLPQGWAQAVKGKLREKTLLGIQKAENIHGIPYTTSGGQWVAYDIGWWTNGFWPAQMWQMALLCGDEIYRETAIRAEERMDEAFHDWKALNHDMGFMWLIHSGVRHELERNQDSFDRALFAAKLLASRYNPNGFIRAWPGEENQGWAIIDCMMNLPLLHWASRRTNDPRFKLMAMRHADRAMAHFVRPDGSCSHIVCFDPEMGDYLSAPAGQGYAPGSSWSRGQAWALYGFTLSYLCTGKREYLDTAVRVADYFIICVRRTDWLALCDFRAPQEPVVWDSAAGAIAASGLLELAGCLSESEGERYLEAACHMLLALEEKRADWSQSSPAILTGCAAAYHKESARDMTMIYADYYFIEAIGKVLGQRMLFWMPDVKRENMPSAGEAGSRAMGRTE